MESIISYLKEKVKENLGRIELDVYGICLDTYCDSEEENLYVTDLKVKDGCLYGCTNWGFINLEETIIDIDDWYTLEDIVKDIME